MVDLATLLVCSCSIYVSLDFLGSVALVTFHISLLSYCGHVCAGSTYLDEVQLLLTMMTLSLRLWAMLLHQQIKTCNMILNRPFLELVRAPCRKKSICFSMYKCMDHAPGMHTW